MKKLFILRALLIAVVIGGVLAGIALPVYRNSIEKSKAKVCETNLKMLQAAIEIYGLDKGVLPASLTQLEPGDFQKAWAQIFKKENQWLIKLAYLLIDFDNRGLAYAQEGFFNRYLTGNFGYITCPSDPTPPPTGISYGLNERLAHGLKYEEYRRLKDAGETLPVIADCEKSLFNSEQDFTRRHHQIETFSTVAYAQVRVMGRDIAKDTEGATFRAVEGGGLISFSEWNEKSKKYSRFSLFGMVSEKKPRKNADSPGIAEPK